MKLVGVVQWKTRDKTGNPIAGVRPLVELQKADWRAVDADDEFPSQGQVFWPNAQSAVEGALVIFRAEPNLGQKDEFKVVDPKSVCEVLDLRSYGTAVDVRAALASGIKVSVPMGTTARVFAWCKPDELVGPIELTLGTNGSVKLSGANLHHLPASSGAHVRSVMVDRSERLLRVDDSAPSRYVDWDDDHLVLRRALEAAVRVEKQAGREKVLTKKQIEDAARALVTQGVGPDAQLDRYRLERALALLEDTELVTSQASDLTELLREHPAIKLALDALSAKVRADVEQIARDDLEQQLARERADLKTTTESRDRAKAQLDASEREVRSAEERLTELRSQVAVAGSEIEAAVDARVLAALDRPLELLAEVGVLRPLLGAVGSRISTNPTAGAPTNIHWPSSRGEDIKDKAMLRRMLTNAARVRGVEPSLMLQLHASVSAALVPITLGPSSLSALTAYAQGACGGRLLVIHVSPTALQPRDFEEVPGGGLLAAARAAMDVDGVSLVILEGANRSPLEASMLPLLQMSEAGLSPISSARGLRIAATLVAGATTVPVTSQLWSHATAIYPEPGSNSGQSAISPGTISLSSELFALGDVPTEVVDALIDVWPDCGELRPVLGRFGSALSRLYDEEPRVTEALLHGLILPYVATSLSAEEQVDALGRVEDKDGAIALALRRLRRRLC
ncbi:hypothetical protein MNQ95_07470 [Pseudoxanthomonas daejeonensis]|uniref:hypothetical protein n=1 Tax=Pseudoxanthomonas daejeonensis TaxID=266062 RepID=UPI001F53F810|nr:hypothetical protein [Pseudoxanthomonas daejeonensis]UNK58902.1 hypothetical protein MNQ95_07470 [Pseudoxanthomonas daejeonensis]